MRDIRIAAAQFEHRNNDKAYNLSRIDALTHHAVNQGAEIVSFHECCDHRLYLPPAPEPLRARRSGGTRAGRSVGPCAGGNRSAI